MTVRCSYVNCDDMMWMIISKKRRHAVRLWVTEKNIHRGDSLITKSLWTFNKLMNSWSNSNISLNSVLYLVLKPVVYEQTPRAPCRSSCPAQGGSMRRGLRGSATGPSRSSQTHFPKACNQIFFLPHGCIFQFTVCLSENIPIPRNNVNLCNTNVL